MHKFYKTACIIIVLFLIVPGCKKDKTPDSVSTPLNVQTRVITTGITETLNAVHFLNEQVGYVGGVNGGIYKTTNAGQNWVSQNTGVNTAVRDIFFTDALTGFATGGESVCAGTGCVVPGGYILRTTDGGQTWVKLNVIDPTLISAIYFTSSTVGFCISYNTIYKTTNAGLSWSPTAFANLGSIMSDIKFTDSQHGYVTCLHNKILQTTDGGANWQVATTTATSGYAAIATGNGYTYISGQQKVIKSTDNGVTWQQLSNSFANIFYLQFIDAQQGVGFGLGSYSGGDFGHYYPGIYTTADGGSTWTAKTDITEFETLRGISFPLKNLGYGIDNNKLIRISLN
jgi:photosystem II stability/assembly factor-like uncharacterized protein